MIEEVSFDPHILSSRTAVDNLSEYVSAFILDEKNAGLVLEKADLSRWHLVGGELLTTADPMGAVQRFLRKKTGYKAQEWFYLGSYQQENESGEQIGHFFLARGLQQDLVKVAPPLSNDWHWKWVPLAELRRGLLDGRFLNISYAINVSLSLLMLPQLGDGGCSL